MKYPERCGKCPACLRVEKAKTVILKAINHAIAEHRAADDSAMLWNDTLNDNPCEEWIQLVFTSMPDVECVNPHCNKRTQKQWASSEMPGYFPHACDEDCAKAAFQMLKVGDFEWVKGNQRIKKADGTLGGFVGHITRCPNSPWHHIGTTCSVCGLEG